MLQLLAVQTPDDRTRHDEAALADAMAIEQRWQLLGDPFTDPDRRGPGAGLCDPDAVDLLVREGPKYVVELLEWGAQFDRETDGSPSLGHEAAHTVRRVLHARDATGREIGRLLWSRVSANPRIRVLQDADATDLVVANGTCTGVRFLSNDGVGTATAQRTLIASGAAGPVCSVTPYPE